MAKIEEIPYSQAIGEIKEIVAKLSSGEIDIDTLPKEVKRGAELISMCKKRLRTTEESIDKAFKEEE